MARFESRLFDSIGSIGASGWKALYGDAAEGGEYFHACERARPPSFELSAVGVLSNERLIACAPVFRTVISLDLVLDGVARWMINGLGKVAPSVAAVPIVAIGTPHSHDANMAFDPGLSALERNDALGAMIDALEASANARRADIFLFKDVSSDTKLWADAVLRRRGYSRMLALPVATLRTPASEDEYVRGLSTNMRSNLRRRLKRAQNIRVEIRTNTDGIDAELQALRASTMGRAATDYDVFEEISPSYYREVLQGLGDKARLLTYWLDKELIGFSLVLLGRDKLIQTYNGMRYPQGPDNGLFYLDWMTQVRLCIENGIPLMQSGVTTYLIKARLGCEFNRSYLYVRHRNPVFNVITKTVCPFINLERSDLSLRELGAAAPFV
ncbi:MAG: GNAT family N-acetyltransferase [Hyphomicrobiaceae bacterium]